ncbi:MAG: RluA family pseudouridine synthase [Kiritimatiellae bacterium]|nr:RluA family pseudouridine synthase [Kiritimatiellia bacterium]
MRKVPGNIEQLLVGKPDNDTPLQDFLAARCGLSRRAAKAIIDGRSVWVNRKCIWIARHTLHTGDTVEVPRAVVSAAKRQPGSDRSGGEQNAQSAARPSSARHVRVILETPDYIVADKPAGVVSCGDPKSVEMILRLQLHIPTLEAVHRLDRDTTGCLLFAKTHTAFNAAVEVFKTHSVKKTYHAIVAGRFPHMHETVNAPIDGKPAVSHVTREMASQDASFLKVRIETGRTNQIRKHLSSIRFPIVGDRTFGLKTARDARLMTVGRQMLHASGIELPDPMRNAKDGIRAHSPLPADFRQCLKTFGMGKK